MVPACMQATNFAFHAVFGAKAGVAYAAERAMLPADGLKASLAVGKVTVAKQVAAAADRAVFQSDRAG